MTAPAPPPPPRGAHRPPDRVVAVDVLRGLVMLLMALDHTRDYFGSAAADPTDLRAASTALFLTRWVTHFCAPVFFLLTGTGAYLSRARRTPAGLSRFLLTRGLWLVLLEVTLARALWQFNVDYRVTLLTVLWALGWSMVALAGLSRLPPPAVAAFGASLVALHNLADPVSAPSFGVLAPLWTVLHQPGPLLATPRALVFVAYPLVPWIGVAAVGFGLGPVLAWPAARRRALLLRLGVGLVAVFVLLRAARGYGDPRPWSPQPGGLRTVLAFVNTTKYPPSLLFLLMTLGPALLVLRGLDARLTADRNGAPGEPARSNVPQTADHAAPRPAHHGAHDRSAGRPVPRLVLPALVFGQVPLFYYLLHVALIHTLAVVVSAVRFGSVHGMADSPTLDRFPITQAPGWPMALPAVYLAWVTVVVLAYPCCRWYAGVKARSTSAWVRYL